MLMPSPNILDIRLCELRARNLGSSALPTLLQLVLVVFKNSANLVMRRIDARRVVACVQDNILRCEYNAKMGLVRYPMRQPHAAVNPVFTIALFVSASGPTPAIPALIYL